jgi:extradiol dioxygenase family protein
MSFYLAFLRECAPTSYIDEVLELHTDKSILGFLSNHLAGVCVIMQHFGAVKSHRAWLELSVPHEHVSIWRTRYPSRRFAQQTGKTIVGIPTPNSDRRYDQSMNRIK